MDALWTLVALLLATAALSLPLGRWLHWIMDPPDGGRNRRFESWCQRALGGAGCAEQDWRGYAKSMLLVNAVMFGIAAAVLALQHHLPLNPDGKVALAPSLWFHTAASFVTNTNLQHYAGEQSLSYLSQLCLMWLQFTTPATGLAALVAIARALSGRSTVGNFHLDLLRAVLLVLLPLALPLAALLALGGVPMTLEGAAVATTLEGAVQTLCRGPVAAFVAIKQLGTNGGGYFGPNSTHPFENPGFWTNALSCAAILLLPMACVWLFGRIVRRPRHATVLFAVMAVLFVAKAWLAVAAEQAPSAAFAGLPIASDVGNLEGKELRFGAAAGPLWAVATTSTSNGSVNCMHDSLQPLAGLAALLGMWLNATFGGVGVGTINMLLYVVLAVFLAGMLVGRTPEYLGRRVELAEVRLAALAVFAHAALILAGTAVFAALPCGAGTVANPGPHGFSEILYEFSSAAANNGSGFEGLGDATVPWNVTTGIVMLLGRFLPILLPMAIAGALAQKRLQAPSAATLGVEHATFATMLLGTIVLLGALTFLPAAALGPLAEHAATPR
jgi:K+-transporting ATPase ATPase A chain